MQMQLLLDWFYERREDAGQWPVVSVHVMNPDQRWASLEHWATLKMVEN